MFVQKYNNAVKLPHCYIDIKTQNGDNTTFPFSPDGFWTNHAYSDLNPNLVYFTDCHYLYPAYTSVDYKTN